MDKTRIEISNMDISYKRKNILKDVSFKINEGERVALVGRNGCGKSTLIQVLTGVKKPKKGKLTYYGQNPLKNKALFGKLCGYVPQDNPIMEELTVADNLKLWSVVKNKKPDEMIDYLNLAEIMKTPVSKLSGGMKRRVAIACSMMGWPPILIMDEPTTALDYYYKDSILELLDEQKKRGGIVIVATHEDSEIKSCDRILNIRDGKLTEIQSMEELKNGR